MNTEPILASSAFQVRPGGPGGAHVLLLEPEDGLREDLERALEADGHRVTSLSHACDAQRFLAEALVGHTARGRLDVLVAAASPGSRGALELLTFVYELGVHVPSVVMDGSGDPTTWTRAQLLGVAAVLEKPVRSRDLTRSVRRALRGTTS